MQDPPKAQRLQRLLNKDDFDCISENQALNLIEIIEEEAREVVKVLRDNLPFTLKQDITRKHDII